MKSLSCMAVEDGGIVRVVIDDFNNVGLLKDVIKEKKMYNFPVEQLELYVAKKDGNWLKLNDPDVQHLKNGETPDGITAMMNDTSNRMAQTWNIGDATFGFPDLADAGKDEIHVLIHISEHDQTCVHPKWKAFWYVVASIMLVAWVICNVLISEEGLFVREVKWEALVGILLDAASLMLAYLLAVN